MDGLSVLRRSFESILGNTETAIKCFSVVRPFLRKQIQESAEQNFPGIVDVISDKVLRYGVLAVSKLWDRNSVSIPELLLEMESRFGFDQEFILLQDEVTRIDGSDIVSRLRKFRNKFLAHTDGVKMDASMAFTPDEIENLLIHTLQLVDRMQNVLFGVSFESAARYESYSADALYDWCEMLSVEVPIRRDDNYADALLVTDGDI